MAIFARETHPISGVVDNVVQFGTKDSAVVKFAKFSRIKTFLSVYDHMGFADHPPVRRRYDGNSSTDTGLANRLRIRLLQVNDDMLFSVRAPRASCVFCQNAHVS